MLTLIQVINQYNCITPLRYRQQNHPTFPLYKSTPSFYYTILNYKGRVGSVRLYTNICLFEKVQQKLNWLTPQMPLAGIFASNKNEVDMRCHINATDKKSFVCYLIFWDELCSNSNMTVFICLWNRKNVTVCCENNECVVSEIICKPHLS